MIMPTTTRWPDLGTFWTLPNVLSLSRLVLVIPITLLLWYDGPLLWLFALVMLAILTDWFDGRLARWLDTESEWGKVLDPIADKIGAVATISALTFRTAEPSLPVWFFIALMTRDLLILAGSLLIVRRSGKVAASVWAGKAATFWLAVTVLAAVLKADPPVMQFCVWMTTALLALSFVVYLIRYLNAARRTPPPQPMPADEGIADEGIADRGIADRGIADGGAVEEMSRDDPRREESLAQVSPEDVEKASGRFVPPSGGLTETRSAAGDGTPGQSPESPSGAAPGTESASDSDETRSPSGSADPGKSAES